MKNLIKGIISYTALVSIPIICIGAIFATAAEAGYKDGLVDGIELGKGMKTEENEE